MKNKKSFRLNVILGTPKDLRPNARRDLLLDTLKRIAFLYHLDYAIDERTPIFDDIEKSDVFDTDLIYLRSTDDCRWSLKVVQSVIKLLAEYESPLIEGMQLFYQNQQITRKYPFPNIFYRPLNYPFVEYHKDGHMSVLTIPTDRG